MKKPLPLATQIFIGLVLGIIAGLICMATDCVPFANEYIKPFGTIFLNLIKFIVVPIVLSTIIVGIISLKDIKTVGVIGIKTICFYIATTAFAVTVGLIISNLFKGTYGVLQTSGLVYWAKEAPSIMDTIIAIFPSNAFTPLQSATMLQVIVIAIFFGFGIILSKEKGKPMANVVESFADVAIQIMSFIIKLSPYGVFCLITPVVAENGPKVLGSLALVILCAYIGYILHAVIVYSIAVKTMGKMSPLTFFKGMMPAIIFAFSSASSVGTMPLNMECARKLSAKKSVISFIIPLGATINMDGTAIYQGVCSIFIASCFGIDLTMSQMIVIVLTATLASIGTAGVPGAGMIMLAMVLQSVGLPVEGIALVAGIDRIFDMGRTAVNITGDAACAICVSKSIEEKLKDSEFDKEEA